MTSPSTEVASLAKRPKRADALRNYEKLVAAAREAFTEADRSAALEDIARRAGVGIGTLYRNFPGRRELLEALYAEEVDGICAAAGAPGGPAPGARLAAWLRGLFAFFASKQHIAAELLKHTDGGDPVFGGGRARVIAAGQPLLAAAQHAGEARGDLTIEQVLDLIHAVATIDGDSGYVQPVLQAALDGLRLRAS